MFTRQTILLLLLAFFFSGTVYAAQWSNVYSGIGNYSNFQSVEQTSDDGFIVAGETPINGDAWVLKLDSNGDIVWQKTYGGSDREWASVIHQTSDGGYIMGGASGTFTAGSNDGWIVKLDGNGNIVWEKSYGGTAFEAVADLAQTSDDGYVVVSAGESFGDTDGDIWVLKLDSSGNIVWQKTYGGADSDGGQSVKQTSDGGYIVAGNTRSFDVDNGDGWVLKLDSSGNIVWQKTYGGADSDMPQNIQQTSDGGYIVAGGIGVGLSTNKAWVFKLDNSGNVEWQKTYSGPSNSESAESVRQSSDGGYIIAGYTASFGAGNGDAWLLKLDSSGNIVWQKTYGGTNGDGIDDIQQTSDGGYITAGRSSSYRNGNTDGWVLKLDSMGVIPGCSNLVSHATVNNTNVTETNTNITPGVTDAKPVNSDATVSTRISAPIQACVATIGIPTMTEWGMILMSLILAGSAFWMIRRRTT